LSRPLRIFVAAPPPVFGHAGATWALLHYRIGLSRLGHKVRMGGPQEFDGLKFDIVVNTSGLLDPERIAAIPIRVYLDLDPAFNQLWHEQGVDRRFDGHTHFVTVGQAIGSRTCEVPTHGLDWIGILPPVVMDEWPPSDQVVTRAFTTVANMRSYGPIDRMGVLFGQKVHSLRAFRNLPLLANERFLIAMRLHPEESEDVTALITGGWEFADPDMVAATPRAYRQFVRGSLAEIGIAKSGYVVSRCGWFSDRSACYLASGRPVIAQETGFSQFLPTGRGLLGFADVDSAVHAVANVCDNYGAHSRAARRLAEEYLDSDRVLSNLLEKVCA